MMSVDRRHFLNFTAAAIATGIFAAVGSAHQRTISKIKAIAFDAFPIFDARPVFALAEQLFPGKGTELSNVWRTRQFEYQWLRALSQQYANFWRVTEDSLIFAAEFLSLDLTPAKREKLMGAYLQLRAWPEVPIALHTLKSAGIQLAFLSNATANILECGIKNSGLENVFDHVLSTDKLKTYKPSPRAYKLAIDAFAMRKEEVLFVAFAGWDAAGAKSFGYPTFWVNRLNSTTERLGFVPDGIGKNLDDLIAFVNSWR